jgi:hypothetical protein
MNAPTLNLNLNLNLLPSSIAATAEAGFGLARTDAGLRLAVLALEQSPGLATIAGGRQEAAAALLADFEGETSEQAGKTLLLGPASPRNAAALRRHLPWLRPQPLGLRTSAGLGDRLGLATPGHVQAVAAAGGGIAPIFAQQSIREMTRTGRTPQQVMDDATWGVFQEGWQAGVGADADHLKTTADIDACAAAGFTFFTIDPSEHVDAAADTDDAVTLGRKYDALPWLGLETSASALRTAYVGKWLEIEGHEIAFDDETLVRAAVKYGRAVVHVAAMYRHLTSLLTPVAPSPLSSEERGEGRGERGERGEVRARSLRRRNRHPDHPRRTPLHCPRAAQVGRQVGQPGPALRRPVRERGRLHRRSDCAGGGFGRTRGHRAQPGALQAQPALRLR